MLRTRVALTAMTLASSALSFLSYTAFLKYLGASGPVELLFYAASMPISLAGVVSGSLLYLLPPIFTRLQEARQSSTLRFLAGLSVAIAIAASVVGILCVLEAGAPAFWLLWLGFTLTAGLQVVSTLQICLAQARGQYLQTGIAPLIASAGLFVGAVSAIATRHEWFLLIGQFAGIAVAVSLLFRGLDLRAGINLRRDMVIGLAAFAPVRKHMLAIAMGTTAFTLFQPVDAILCRQLDSGSMAIMAYAQRVLVALSTAISLGAYAIAARSSHETLRQGGHAALRRQANLETLRILAFGLSAWIGFEAVGDSLLAALLSSSAMSSADIARLVQMLRWMLVGIGPMAAAPYLFRVFYSLQDYRKPALLGIGVAPAYGAIGWLLRERLGLLSLAVAYIGIWWLILGAALLCLNRVPAGIQLASRSSGA